MVKDLEIEKLIQLEEQRQQETLTLIPSENYAPRSVREVIGSVLSNKYSEGYAGKRYYEGNEVIDQIELLAIERAKKVFNVPFANVQSYSGSPANSEVLFALAEAGSSILGLKLASGGHLTHGHPKVTFSGKYYNSIQFGLDENARIDYEQMQKLARDHKPKVIMLGTTAYPFKIDWQLARQIADEVGAFLVADISHEAGLVAAGVLPSPVEYAHVVTSTTHKTLRGPRGAVILVTDSGILKDSDLPKKIDAAVMPGMQGGPHDNTTAGIAVSLEEAMTLEFKEYAAQILLNAKVLAQELIGEGMKLVGGGTENHLMIVDFSASSMGKGTLVAAALNSAGIVANRNTVPSDTSAFYPSGLRLGTPAVTTRGMREEEMKQIAKWIYEVAEVVGKQELPSTGRVEFLQKFREEMSNHSDILSIRNQVKSLCAEFPIV